MNAKADPLKADAVYESLGRLRDCGSCGALYKARRRVDDGSAHSPELAVWLLGLGRERLSAAVEDELVTQLKCLHPHVLALKDVHLLPESLAVFTELVNGGDLAALITKAGGAGLPEAKARWLFQQVLIGVDYLHRMGFAQRDIRPDNILVVDSDAEWPHLKIADFGFCEASSECGPSAYMAPEVRFAVKYGEPYDGHRADLWSCGVLLYAMLSGKSSPDLEASFPDYLQGEDGALQRKLDAGISLPPQLSAKCQDFVRQLIVADPHSRYSVADCLQHPWFCKCCSRYCTTERQAEYLLDLQPGTCTGVLWSAMPPHMGPGEAYAALFTILRSQLVVQSLPPGTSAMNDRCLRMSRDRLPAQTERQVRALVALGRGDGPRSRASLRTELGALVGAALPPRASLCDAG